MLKVKVSLLLFVSMLLLSISTVFADPVGNFNSSERSRLNAANEVYDKDANSFDPTNAHDRTTSIGNKGYDTLQRGCVHCQRAYGQEDKKLQILLK